MFIAVVMAEHYRVVTKGQQFHELEDAKTAAKSMLLEAGQMHAVIDEQNLLQVEGGSREIRSQTITATTAIVEPDCLKRQSYCFKRGRVSNVRRGFLAHPLLITTMKNRIGKLLWRHSSSPQAADKKTSLSAVVTSQLPCPWSRLFPVYLEGRLAGDVRSRMETHMARCEVCRRELESLFSKYASSFPFFHRIVRWWNRPGLRSLPVK